MFRAVRHPQNDIKSPRFRPQFLNGSAGFAVLFGEQRVLNAQAQPVIEHQVILLHEVGFLLA